jgi:hypothetical protein
MATATSRASPRHESRAGRGEAREVAVAMSNKLSLLLYPMILKTSQSYDDVMEIFAKQISTYFVTLEVLNIQGIRYRT